MTTEGMEAQEQAWKEWIAYRKRNSSMTLEEEKDLSLKMGVFDSYEEPEDLEDLEDLDDLE